MGNARASVIQPEGNAVGCSSCAEGSILGVIVWRSGTARAAKVR